jgi:hypothetical protein
MSKQYKVTHDEAAILEIGLMSIDLRLHDFMNKEEAIKAANVIAELKNRMNRQAVDYRYGRTSDINFSNHTPTFRAAAKRLYKKYFKKQGIDTQLLPDLDEAGLLLSLTDEELRQILE